MVLHSSPTSSCGSNTGLEHRKKRVHSEMSRFPDNVESSHGKGKTREGNAHWDSTLTTEFTDVCAAQVTKGSRHGGKFSKLTWDIIVGGFNRQTGRNYTQKQLKHRWDNLRKDWILWEAMNQNEIGLGWDPQRNTVAASDDWWERKSQAAPGCIKFREKGLENIDNMTLMFCKSTATRVRAYNLSHNKDGEYLIRAPDVDVDDVDEGERGYGGDFGVDEGDDDNAVSGGDVGVDVISVDEGPSQPRKRRYEETAPKRRVRKGLAYVAELLVKAMTTSSASLESASAARYGSYTVSGPPQTFRVPQCLALVDEIQQVSRGDAMYICAAKMFKEPIQREIWMSLSDTNTRYNYLVSEYIDRYPGGTYTYPFTAPPPPPPPPPQL